PPDQRDQPAQHRAVGGRRYEHQFSDIRTSAFSPADAHDDADGQVPLLTCAAGLPSPLLRSLWWRALSSPGRSLVSGAASTWCSSRLSSAIAAAPSLPA